MWLLQEANLTAHKSSQCFDIWCPVYTGKEIAVCLISSDEVHLSVKERLSHLVGQKTQIVHENSSKCLVCFELF